MLAHLALITSLAVAVANPVDLETRQQPSPNSMDIRPGLGCSIQPPYHVGYGSAGPYGGPLPNGDELGLSQGARYFLWGWLLPPGGQGQIRADDYYKNKCVDAGSNPGNGIRLKLWDCYDVPQQQWKIHDNKIELVGYNLCFDVVDGLLSVQIPNSSPGGGFMQTWECADGNPNQMFYTVPYNNTR